MLTDDKQLKDWSWWARVLPLSALWFSVFLIAEHKSTMASVQNFVLEIDEQESWAQGGNTLRRLGFATCAGVGMLGLLVGRWKNFQWNAPIILLLLYLAWSGATILWSIDGATSIRRFMLMICCVIGCFGTARFFSIEQILFATVIAFSGWLLFGLYCEISLGAFRPHKGDYRFAGSVHPNLQAANLAMMCIAAFTLSMIRPNYRWFFWSWLAIGFLFLLLTKCRTVAAVLPLSLAAIWFFMQSPRMIALGLLLGTWVIATIALGFQVTQFDPVEQFGDVLLLGRGEETGTNLTGRLPLWKDLSQYISQRPMHGHGFAAFWTPRNIYDIAASQQWVISEAHSSYVESALHTGLVGTFLMVAVAISTLVFGIQTYRRTNQPELVFIIGGVLFCLIRGVTESGLSGPAGFTSPIFMAMASYSWRSGQLTHNHDPTSQFVPTNDLMNPGAIQ